MPSFTAMAPMQSIVSDERCCEVTENAKNSLRKIKAGIARENRENNGLREGKHVAGYKVLMSWWKILRIC